MSLKRTVIGNTLAQFLGRFSTSALGFATTIILARSLAVSQYGSYAKLYALAGFFYLFVDFGLNAVYVRQEHKDLRLFPLIPLIRTGLFVLSMGAVAVLFVLTGTKLFSSSEQFIAPIVLATVLLFGYFTSFNIVFQLSGRYDRSVLASLLGSGSGLILLLLLPHTVFYAVSAIAVGYAITVMIGYLFAQRLRVFQFFPSIGLIIDGSYRKLAYRMLDLSLPVGLMLFFNTMYSHVDVFIISAYKGNSAVAIYQLAYKFFEFPLAFATFFANAIFPHYVTLYQHNRARFFAVFTKATGGLFIVSLIFTLALWILAPYLGLIKAQYYASALPLQILALSFPFFFLTSPLSWFLFLARREWLLVVIYATGFLFNVVLNLWFVPIYGYLASSWITVAGEGGILLALAVATLYTRKS